MFWLLVGAFVLVLYGLEKIEKRLDAILYELRKPNELWKDLAVIRDNTYSVLHELQKLNDSKK